jgi:hypothetical protein
MLAVVADAYAGTGARTRVPPVGCTDRSPAAIRTGRCDDPTTRSRALRIVAARAPADHASMDSWTAIAAERAFRHAARARRRASLLRRLRRACEACSRLTVHDEGAVRRSGGTARRGMRAIPIEAITGTVEPHRAAQFDREFRPAPVTRTRWQRVWLAEERGTVLPPISVVPVPDGYAIRDGHHRVSVARARGAVAIDAVVATA